MYYLGITIIPRCPYAEVEEELWALLEKYTLDNNFKPRSAEPIYIIGYELCQSCVSKSRRQGLARVIEENGDLRLVKNEFFAANPGAKWNDFFAVHPEYMDWRFKINKVSIECFEKMLGVKSDCPDCGGMAKIKKPYDLRRAMEYYIIGHNWHGVITGQARFFEQMTSSFVMQYGVDKNKKLHTRFVVEGVQHDPAAAADEYEHISANVADPAQIPPEMIPVAIVTPDGGWNWQYSYYTEGEWQERVRSLWQEYGNKGYWGVTFAMRD